MAHNCSCCGWCFIFLHVKRLCLLFSWINIKVKSCSLTSCSFFGTIIFSLSFSYLTFFPLLLLFVLLVVAQAFEGQIQRRGILTFAFGATIFSKGVIFLFFIRFQIYSFFIIDGVEFDLKLFKLGLNLCKCIIFLKQSIDCRNLIV